VIEYNKTLFAHNKKTRSGNNNGWSRRLKEYFQSSVIEKVCVVNFIVAREKGERASA
jgi:hypothetical protein